MRQMKYPLHQTNLEGTLIRSQDARDQETEPGLLVGERRRRIMDLLGKHGRVTVEALASRFATPVATIRTDLAALAAKGTLERTHVSALLRRDDDDRPLAVKRTLHHAEKVRIARTREPLPEGLGNGSAALARRSSEMARGPNARFLTLSKPTIN
ncbi:MAG: DeoR family transcriptional regulator [Pseudomonadota bacterium]|nr:DeoR family transcriptional regulator [Pseudomonadota bacterium]